MSLSLVPIVHSSIELHMGPEPSYIINKQNGYTFSRGSYEDLAEVINNALSNDNHNIVTNAFETYEDLIKKRWKTNLLKLHLNICLAKIFVRI